MRIWAIQTDGKFVAAHLPAARALDILNPISAHPLTARWGFTCTARELTGAR